MSRYKNYRQHLIERGLLTPGIKVKCLTMDETGRVAAMKHIADYLMAPWIYVDRPFQCEPPPDYCL